MRLPELMESGELPLGVHRASLRETLERFGVGHPQRIAVGERLERIYRVAAATGHLVSFVVFESFVTDKRAPNDVDVFLIMDDAFDGDTLRGESAMLFDHGAADVHFGASASWVRHFFAAFGGAQSTIEYWQAKRGGGKRGIIEIVEETNDH